MSKPGLFSYDYWFKPAKLKKSPPVSPRGWLEDDPNYQQEGGTQMARRGGGRVDAWEGQGPDRITDLEATGDFPAGSGGQAAPPTGESGLHNMPARTGKTWGNAPGNKVVQKGGARGKYGQGGASRSAPMTRQEADAYEVELAEQGAAKNPDFFKASAAEAAETAGEEEYGMFEALTTGWGEAFNDGMAWAAEVSGFKDVVEAVQDATKAGFSGDTARLLHPTQDALRTTKRLAARIKASGGSAKKFFENRGHVKNPTSSTQMAEIDHMTDAMLDELPVPEMPPDLLEVPDFLPDANVPGPLSAESVKIAAEINRVQLAEVMHDMPAFDGKVGTYDMTDPEDLTEVLTKLKAQEFPKEVIPEETVQEVLEQFGARPEAEDTRVVEPQAPAVPEAQPDAGVELQTFQRAPDDPHTWLQRQSVELMETLPDQSVSVGEQMEGSGVTPYELEMYERNVGQGLEPELEVLEMRSIQLSGPATNETGPFLLRGAAGIKPAPTEYFTKGKWQDPDETGPDLGGELGEPPKSADPWRPAELGDAAGGRGIEMSDLADIPGLLEEKQWELPSGEVDNFFTETIDMGTDLAGGEIFENIMPSVFSEYMSGAGGLAMGGVFTALTLELTPLITDMVSGDFLWPGAPGTHAMDVMQWQRDDVDGRQGPHYEAHKKIRSYFDEHPMYVWFRDNGRAGKEYLHTFFDDTAMQLTLTGTGLWKRARICDLQGQAAGILQVGWPEGGDEGYTALDGSGGYHQPPGLYIFLRVGNGKVPSQIKYNEFYTWKRLTDEPLGFFFRYGYDGILIKDTKVNARACIMQNYKALHAYKPHAALTTAQRFARLQHIGFGDKSMGDAGELNPLLYHPWDLPDRPWDYTDTPAFLDLGVKPGQVQEGDWLREDTRDWVDYADDGEVIGPSGRNPGKIGKGDKFYHDPITGRDYGGNKGHLMAALAKLRQEKIDDAAALAKKWGEDTDESSEDEQPPEHGYQDGMLDPSFRLNYRAGYIDPAHLKKDEWFIYQGEEHRVVSVYKGVFGDADDPYASMPEYANPDTGLAADPWGYFGYTTVKSKKQRQGIHSWPRPSKPEFFVKLLDKFGKQGKRKKPPGETVISEKVIPEKWVVEEGWTEPQHLVHGDVFRTHDNPTYRVVSAKLFNPKPVQDTYHDGTVQINVFEDVATQLQGEPEIFNYPGWNKEDYVFKESWVDFYGEPPDRWDTYLYPTEFATFKADKVWAMQQQRWFDWANADVPFGQDRHQDSKNPRWVLTERRADEKQMIKLHLIADERYYVLQEKTVPDPPVEIPTFEAAKPKDALQTQFMEWPSFRRRLPEVAIEAPSALAKQFMDKLTYMPERNEATELITRYGAAGFGENSSMARPLMRFYPSQIDYKQSYANLKSFMDWIEALYESTLSRMPPNQKLLSSTSNQSRAGAHNQRTYDVSWDAKSVNRRGAQKRQSNKTWKQVFSRARGKPTSAPTKDYYVYSWFRNQEDIPSRESTAPDVVLNGMMPQFYPKFLQRHGLDVRWAPPIESFLVDLDGHQIISSWVFESKTQKDRMVELGLNHARDRKGWTQWKNDQWADLEGRLLINTGRKKAPGYLAAEFMQELLKDRDAEIAYSLYVQAEITVMIDFLNNLPQPTIVQGDPGQGTMFGDWFNTGQSSPDLWRGALYVPGTKKVLLANLDAIRDALYHNCFEGITEWEAMSEVFTPNAGNSLFDNHQGALIKWDGDEDIRGRARELRSLLAQFHAGEGEAGEDELPAPEMPQAPIPPPLPSPAIPADTASQVAADASVISFNAAGSADQLPSHYGAMSEMTGGTSQPAWDPEPWDEDQPEPPLQPMLQQPPSRKRARSPSPALSQAVSHGPFVPVGRPVRRQRTDPPGTVVVRSDPRGDDPPDSTGDYVMIGVGLGVLVLLWALQENTSD